MQASTINVDYARRAAPEGAPPCGVVSGAERSEAPGLVLSKTSCPQQENFEISTRGEVVFDRRFARMRRSVWWAGQGHSQRFSALFGQRAWFLTLTYRQPSDWRPQHIARALNSCRKWLKRKTGQPLRYVWVAELQKRGALHYHVVVYLPKALSMPMWDKQGWWPHGFTQRERAKSAIGYLMKYVSKISPFHKFPKGCHLFGIGGLNEQARSIRTWHNYPEWLKQKVGVNEVVRKPMGFVVRATGEILSSPWVVLRGTGRIFLRAIEPLPERWVHGPYSRLATP